VLVAPDVTAAIVTVWLLLLQDNVTVLVVTVDDNMASENVSVNAVLRATSVVPLVAMVVEPCTSDDTTGTLEVVAKINVTADAKAVPAVFLTPVPIVKVQSTPSGRAADGVMV